MKYFYVAFLTIILLFSCNTDLDINADYKDITIVYGILDKNSDYQYIKINKAFLGEIASTQMAQVSDSVLYKKADVSLIKSKNGNYIKTINFNYTDTIKKNTGIFANDKNIIYVTDEKIIEESELNDINDFKYKLVVKIPNKEIVSSETVLISDIEKKTDSLNKIDDVNLYKSLGFNSGHYYLYNLKFINADNAYITEVFVQCFFYNKYENLYLLDSTIFKLGGNTITHSPNFNQELIFTFNGKEFYNKLHEKLKNSVVTKRYFYCIRFGFLSAGRGLSDYIEQTSLNYSEANNWQAFSNITNGYGVFSSKSFSYSDYMFLDYDSGSLNHLSEANSPTFHDNFVKEGKVLEFFDKYEEYYDIYDLYNRDK